MTSTVLVEDYRPLPGSTSKAGLCNVLPLMELPHVNVSGNFWQAA